MGTLGVFFLYAGVITGVFALIAFAADKMDERDPQLAEDMRRLYGVDEPSPLRDPDWQQQDAESWDRRKALEEGERG